MRTTSHVFLRRPDFLKQLFRWAVQYADDGEDVNKPPMEELGAGLRDGVRARVRALARLLEAQLASGAAERAELAREGVRCALGGAPWLARSA